MLQTFPDAFYKATGLVTGIHNLAGELITSIPRDDFCGFCKNMFFSREGHKRCLLSNKMGARIAFERSKPYIYRCHAGLIDVAAPIIVNGKHVGTITFGQILIKKLDNRYRTRVQNKLKDLPNKLQKTLMIELEKVRVVPLQQIVGLAQLLSAIANDIVNLIINNIKEKQLNKENTELINEIKAKSLLEKEIKDAQLRLKEAELRVLQAQINPHFLYNTLDSIQWLAVLHGVNDIQQMITALGELLRYSLDHVQNIVPIRKELENVENYLIIQKFRYGEKFSYHLNIEPEVLKFRIPRLLLQPLAENSIKHGLEPKFSHGSIWINGWLEGDEEAVIEVADDGVGMSEDFLTELMESLFNVPEENEAKIEVDNCKHIGLVNVNKRLIYNFGENSALKIRSKINHGTTISFRIPRNFSKGDMLND